MSHLSKIFKITCISALLCSGVTPCGATSSSQVISPTAAYTKTIDYETSCYLNSDNTLKTSFSITVDDTTGVINSISLNKWSLSKPVSFPLYAYCDLLSLTKINNYRYIATFRITVRISISNTNEAIDTVTVTINSPGTRSLHLGESL